MYVPVYSYFSLTNRMNIYKYSYISVLFDVYLVKNLASKYKENTSVNVNGIFVLCAVLSVTQ